jgi:hypothetical protein
VKLLCDACERLGEAASLRVASGQVLARCGRCGAEGSLGALEGTEVEVELEEAPPPSAPAVPAPAPVVAPAPAAEDPYEVPAGRCPKCVAVRPAGAVHCAQCGLAYARFVPAEHRLRPGLDRAWRELLAKWEDPAAHDKLLARAQAEEALPQVARLYQIRLARSDVDAMAQRGREELLRRVTVSASAAVKPQGQPAPGGSRKLLWVGLAGAMGLLLLLLQVMAGRGE